MIVGIGVDIVQVNRMEKWLRPDNGLLERYFHPDEARSMRRRHDASSLAARFAAKEALGKAFGTGLRGLVLKAIKVANGALGKPEFFLFGTAARALEQSGAATAHLSLTHEKEYAVAMVVLET